LGLTDEMPFFVLDDGSYAGRLNRFFRSLPSDGCQSSHTWAAYARDIGGFLDFLHAVYQLHWLDASREHLAHYKAVRRGSTATSGVATLASTSWNRAVASLDRLYGFAVEEGWRDTLPFKYKDVSVVPGADPTYRSSAKSNRLRDPEHDAGDTIKAITLDQYRVFRDVGLRGLLPDGRPDPTVDRRHATRDALFADMLVETGLRITEGSAQLVWEIPVLPTGPTTSSSVETRLAPALAKGRKSRKIRVHSQLVRRLHDYIDIERAHIASDGRAVPRARRATRVSATSFVVEGAATRQKISEATAALRRRLVVRDDRGKDLPVAMWLGEKGVMLTPTRWREIFAAASQRCTALGYPLDVSPHTLRHTFAVHMLERLIAAMVQRSDRAALRHDPSAAAYRRLMGDPLRHLQRMLGHKSITTTYAYLTHLEEAVEIALAAVDAFQRDLYAPLAAPV